MYINIIQTIFSRFRSAPPDGESPSQNVRALTEYQAGKNMMVVVSFVSRVATDLLHRAQGHIGINQIHSYKYN